MPSQQPIRLALSSVWACKQTEDGEDLLDRLAATGLASLELEYRLTAPMLEQVRRGLKPRGLGVVSVHNYCPLPPDMPRDRASGDLFNLAAQDKEERLLAVRHTVSTLELAADLEARAVVLHLGWVEGLQDRLITRQAADQGRTTPELAAHLTTRRQASPTTLDAVSFALDRLVRRAMDLGVSLGLENRFHVYQAPSLEEAQALLTRFAGAPVGYWHDTGHAHNLGLAGVTPAVAWLESLGQALLGCHLHDAVGSQDHQAPGQGELDWPALAVALLSAPIKVLEIKPGPTAAEVTQAARLVERAFGQAAADRSRAEESSPQSQP